MKTALAALLIVGCSVGATALAAATTGAATALVLQDDSQRTVSIPRHPRRVISLLPSYTETICALGACDRLVATDRYSNWPTQVVGLPKAGGLDDAQVELIVSLQPDIVFLSRSLRISDRLASLGIRAFVLNTQSYGDIAHTITRIGQILGLEQAAAELNATLDRSVREISDQAQAARHGAGPAVYFEVDRAPYAAGPDSFIGELLQRLGARNIVTPELGPFPKLNPEYVVRHDPDVIFIAGAEAEHLVERPGWEQIRAVKERRFCSFPAAVHDTLVRPGPRVTEGMRAMAECLARVAP